MPGAMERLLVMTVIGPDRPGLVEAVAFLIAEQGFTPLFLPAF